MYHNAWELSTQQIILGEILGESNEPPLGGALGQLAVTTASDDIAKGINRRPGMTYVFETRALVVFQQSVLRTVVAVTEPTISNDPLRGGLALLECTARFNRHGGGWLVGCLFA